MKIIGEVCKYGDVESYIIEMSKLEIEKITECRDRDYRAGTEVDVGAIYSRLVKLEQSSGILKQYTEQLRGIATLLEPLSGHIKDACDGGGK